MDNKRPFFMFYPGDWRASLKLRRCSLAARGAWVEILCALHESDDGYGLLRWPLKDIARATRNAIGHVRELVANGVLCGTSAPNVVLHVDHRVSVADGGSDDDDNLITACVTCNLGKGSLSLRPEEVPL